MTTASALSRLTEPKLRAWLLARMREEHLDPPIAESRLESPDDYVRVVHHETTNEKFRARIEKAALTALRGVNIDHDARAIRNLATLMDGLELREAAPILQTIAEHGAFGGHDDGLDPDAEEMVLFALASLQEPKVLWAKWEALWSRNIPRLWPVVTAGLRLSDPKRALGILPLAVRRAATHPDFPLGEVLWAFATEEQVESEDVAEALIGLSLEERERCREGLGALGAEPNEIAAWVPEMKAQSILLRPWWANISQIDAPPRMVAAA